MASSAKWDNPNHPLYLHHSDQPGAILYGKPWWKIITAHGDNP
jgi:hypothetical protein